MSLIMNIINIILLFISFFLLNTSIDQCKDIEKNSIESDSSVIYEYLVPGIPIGDTPHIEKFEIQCKVGEIKAYLIEIFYKQEGTKEKKTEIYVSKRKYLNFWKKILKYDVWNLTSVRPENLLTEEALFKEYKEIRMEEDNNNFEFRLGKLNNKFEVYDLPMLKNSNYLLITKEIFTLFNLEITEYFFFE